MSQNVAKLTTTQERVARLVAEDALTNAEIANACKIASRTIDRWKALPEFDKEVQRIRETLREQILKEGIADIVVRTQRRQRDWELLQQVQKERGESADFADVPGGTTGLMVRRVKQIGQGVSAEVVEEFAIDTSLLDQKMKLEEAVQKDLGQLVERHDVTSGGNPFGIDIATTEQHIAEIVRRRAHAPVSSLSRRVLPEGAQSDMVEQTD